MSLLGPVSSVSAQALRPPVELDPARLRGTVGSPASDVGGAGKAGGGFGAVFESMVADVEARQSEASALTRSVLLGDNPNLHQSVIAMQEASLSFSLMVEVRNKVVESYQELMRLPV